MRQLDNLEAGKDGGTGEGGELVTQEMITDSDAAKVDANTKSDALDTYNAYKINTPKIDVKRGIGKLCAIAIVLSQCMSLRHHALHESQSAGEVSDTGKFDAKIYAKKEAKEEAKKPTRNITPTRS